MVDAVRRGVSVRAGRRVVLSVAVILVAACGPAEPVHVTQRPSAGTASPSATASPIDFLSGPVAVPVAGSPPRLGRPWFLAVGDSVTAGFTRDPSRAGRNDAWPVQLQALLLGQGRSWDLFDTACSGETTASYVGRCFGRAAIPMLADVSQRDLALAAVRQHHDSLQAIFVDIGNNDLLHAATSPTLATVVQQLPAKISAIVGELTSSAPGVPVVVCTFYDPLANAQPSTLPRLRTLDQTITSTALAHGWRVADFLDAINTGDPPDARLCDLVDCAHLDVHPTIAGHAALAAAAARALS